MFDSCASPVTPTPTTTAEYWLLRTPESNYAHELRTDAEHEALAEALHGARAAIFLSGYHSPLYDSLYTDWHRAEFSSNTGNSSPGAGKRTEVLWANVPMSSDLTLFGEVSA